MDSLDDSVQNRDSKAIFLRVSATIMLTGSDLFFFAEFSGSLLRS
jgi:hypothetical protein